MMTEQQQQNRQGLLSQGQGDRFDRWIEFISAVVLSLATLLTAWSGYQSALWGGEQAKLYVEASNARIEAAQWTSQALIRNNVHFNLFVAYATAVSSDNQALADFLYQRFPPELKVATDDWLAADPLNSTAAPLSPFDLPAYRLAELESMYAAEVEANQKFSAANSANDRADNYVMLTVMFAMVLFFGGISGKFQWRLIDAGMLTLGVVVFLVGLVLLINSPVR